MLAHEPPSDAAGSSITFLTTDITNAVDSALAAAKGKAVVLIGADIARQCVAAGLVDEILVHVAPVLLGDGVRLFSVPGADRVDLEPVSFSQAGRVANLRFRVLT